MRVWPLCDGSGDASVPRLAATLHAPVEVVANSRNAVCSEVSQDQRCVLGRRRLVGPGRYGDFGARRLPLQRHRVA